jgi:hypothetical protein
MEVTMSDLTEKIEKLEARLLYWEKGLFAAYGAALTMLASSAIRGIETSYLEDAFFKSLENIDSSFTENGITVFTDPVVLNLQRALFIPYWEILGYLLLIVILVPAAWLAFHSTWRQVSLTKRQSLIFGYLLAGWIVLLSISVQGSVGGYDYGGFLLAYLLAMALGYGWLRRKKNKAEEVFP